MAVLFIAQYQFLEKGQKFYLWLDGWDSKAF